MFKFFFFQKLLHSLSKKSSHWLPTCQPNRLHMFYNCHCPTSASKTKSKKTHCIHDLCTSNRTQQDGLQLSQTSWIAFQCPRRVAVKVGCFPEYPWQKKYIDEFLSFKLQAWAKTAKITTTFTCSSCSYRCMAMTKTTGLKYKILYKEIGCTTNMVTCCRPYAIWKVIDMVDSLAGLTWFPFCQSKKANQCLNFFLHGHFWLGYVTYMISCLPWKFLATFSFCWKKKWESKQWFLD